MIGTSQSPARPDPRQWGAAAGGRNETGDYWNWYVHPGEMNVTMNGLLGSDSVGLPINLTVANAPGQWGNQTGDAMFDSYIYNSMGLPITMGLPPKRGRADSDA